MTKKNAIPTSTPRQRVLLVGIQIREREGLLSLEDSLSELGMLAETAGLNVVGTVEQRVNKPNPKTLVGEGKVEEIKALADELQADVVLFDEELNPRHQREIEAALGDKVQVLDRTAIILDIFAQHAQTHEGSLQVRTGAVRIPPAAFDACLDTPGKAGRRWRRPLWQVGRCGPAWSG